jgi:hypothetical protein
VPHGSSTEAEKERIGFPVRNPIYDRLVAEAPASGAERID